MAKKPGKAKGLARARTRPAGKKAKGRPFQEKAKRADPDIGQAKAAKPDVERFTIETRIRQRPAPPRFTPARTEKSLLKKSERLDGYASVLAAGMLSNPELIDDLHDQDSIASIIETAIFMATQIDQRI